MFEDQSSDIVSLGYFFQYLSIYGVSSLIFFGKWYPEPREEFLYLFWARYIEPLPYHFIDFSLKERNLFSDFHTDFCEFFLINSYPLELHRSEYGE